MVGIGLVVWMVCIHLCPEPEIMFISAFIWFDSDHWHLSYVADILFGAVNWLVVLNCIADDDLISPCMCKGTQQFVHRSCLDHWRSVKVWFGWRLVYLHKLCMILLAWRQFIIQEGFAFSHCTTCKAQFHLRVALFEDNTWRKTKFRLFVARDVFLVFLVVQTVSETGAFSFYHCLKGLIVSMKFAFICCF